MEKLTLEQIAHYGKGLMANTKENKYKNPAIGLITSIQYDANDDEKIVISTENGYYLSSAENTIPVLRKCDLTKPIMVNGKEEHPLQEIYKICFPNGVNGIKEIISKEGFLHKNKYHFHLSKKGFCMMIGANETKFIAPNQLKAYQYLFKNKHDVFGLIEKGLAVDADTLEVNPYNN